MTQDVSSVLPKAPLKIELAEDGYFDETTTIVVKAEIMEKGQVKAQSKVYASIPQEGNLEFYDRYYSEEVSDYWEKNAHAVIIVSCYFEDAPDKVYGRIVGKKDAELTLLVFPGKRNRQIMLNFSDCTPCPKGKKRKTAETKKDFPMVAAG